MRSSIFRRFAAVSFLLTWAATARGQTLASRIEGVRDGVLRLSFATWADVCGDGSFIGMEVPGGGFVTYRVWNQGVSISSYDYFVPDCRHGPMRLVVTRSVGRTTGLKGAVGVNWLAEASGTDLGDVPAEEVARWLLEAAAQGSAGFEYLAFLGAASAENAAIMDQLVAMVRNRSLDTRVRERALRWVTVAAGRENRAAEGDQVLRTMALDTSEPVALRERAIRALPLSPSGEAFLRELYGRLHETALKDRIIRRMGESHADAAAAWVGDLILDAGQPMNLRERALRVFAQKPGGRQEVRDLYARLTQPALKDRALRIVAEDADESVAAWLRQVAQDRGEPLEARERAIRLMGTRTTAVESLRALYPRLDAIRLRDRMLRVVADRWGAGAGEWLTRVALDRHEEPSLRDRALRLLGEHDPTMVRGLFDRLESSDLKERALRTAAEHGDAATVAWLRALVTDQGQPVSVRDRALRSLAARRVPTADLVALYARVGQAALRRRLVRIYAERADDAAIDQLAAIAKNDPDPDMRRYALRRLAETGNPRAKGLLQGMIEGR